MAKICLSYKNINQQISRNQTKLFVWIFFVESFVYLINEL